ncbi:polyphosphate:nucleotide phosphotransferase, PPK2 family [Catalinimonas alkaloidigena]|uniref:Polyphosphate:nucleotide phosphotransferase, PPK2 family n=1 Tax=Catalinimonas alkaloidigena TaxID=1075417 RepID=A0A1G9N8P6_9BACT|nr:PPK2 family polyphosphate kinase [Catalinimonas alkaloidigena]SDL82912.1 polyphosphate:nucleotide phosphotransferase, PPK2 family [Catalinimonas alkaloidigena]
MKLADYSPAPPDEADKSKIKEETEHLLQTIQERQKMLYAQGKYSLLVILQGLDAAGKDGAINDVFSGLNLLGIGVTAFKAPSELEKSYDFLWRVHREVPARGMIRVFNRSHYEDVLVPKVEQWVDEETVTRRYAHINHFEQLLADHGTVLLKFYLHKSQEEQLKDLTERVTNPQKYWKHNDGDWQIIPKRDLYLDAYEQIFAHCSEVAPWHIVPANKNWYKSYCIAKQVAATLEALPLAWPSLG